MDDIKISYLASLSRRYLTYFLVMILTMSSSNTQLAWGAGTASTAPPGDVSVEGNSAAIQNIGRAMQSPDARSANLPIRAAAPPQSNIVLPDMGDPGGDALSRVDERKYGEMIMRQIRPDPDLSLIHI